MRGRPQPCANGTKSPLPLHVATGPSIPSTTVIGGNVAVVGVWKLPFLRRCIMRETTINDRASDNDTGSPFLSDAQSPKGAPVISAWTCSGTLRLFCGCCRVQTRARRCRFTVKVSLRLCPTHVRQELILHKDLGASWSRELLNIASIRE